MTVCTNYPQGLVVTTKDRGLRRQSDSVKDSGPDVAGGFGDSSEQIRDFEVRGGLAFADLDIRHQIGYVRITIGVLLLDVVIAQDRIDILQNSGLVVMDVTDSDET